MSLYNKKKLEHKKAAAGKIPGSTTKLMNYEYGRNKARKVAINKALNNSKHESKGRRAE